MRNLKRALSLALASVMVVSMMVVGAGAASYDDFSDKDEIVNQEAVQMLVELGVINGKDTGDFDPTGIVTRAEMAKMICVVLNGGKDPSLGTTVTNTYTDTVNHWASGYIEYCTQLGIVAGDGTGKFNPDATVTGSEAAKMLLVALGYKSEVEGFTGANWSIAVNVRANQKELYSDLSISVDEGLTRDDAAQMIYNALDAGVVSYDYTLVSDGSTISSSPTLIDDNDKTLLEDKFNAVKVEGVVLANEHANLESSSEKGASLDSGKTTLLVTNYDDQEYYGNSASTKSETFAISTELEDLGRSVVVYVKKNSNASKAEVLGSAITSSDNKVVVDASTDSIADVADDNNLDLDYSVTQVATNYKGLTDLTSTLANYDSTAGVEKVLIDTDDDGTVDYVLMNTWFFGKVTSYSASGDGSIVVDVGATQTTDVLSKTVTKLTADDADDVVGFEDVAKDDYVLAAYIGGDLHVVVADSVTGTMDSYKDTAPTTKVTVDGTEYNVSNVTGYVGGDDDIRKVADEASGSVKNEATFYLDQNGYVVAMGEATANAGKYAMVLAVGSDINDQVKVALADGTVATYNINDNGVKKSALEIGKVYAYSINSSDEIKLTSVGQAYTEQTGASFEKGKITIKATGQTAQYATSSTVFFYVSDDDGQIINKSSSISSDDVSTYTSYTTAPDVSSTATVTVYTKTLSDNTTRVVAVVFAGEDLVSADVSDNLYVTKIISTDGDDTTVNAFVNGSDELQTIVVSGTDVKLRNTYTYSLNSDGTYDLGANKTVDGISVTNVTGNNFVVTGGQAYTITSDTLVVDHSTYLDSATATLGTSATISKGDNIIGLVANNNDEALMVVIRNSTQTEDDTVDSATVINSDYTVDVFGKTTASDIMNAAVQALESKGYTGITVTNTTGSVALGAKVGTLSAKNGSVTEVIDVYNAARVDFGSAVLGYVHTGGTMTVTGKNSGTSLIVGTANATAEGTFDGSKKATYTFASADANADGIVKLNEATLVTKGSGIDSIAVGSNTYSANMYVTIGTEVTATGTDTTGANVVQVAKTSDNTVLATGVKAASGSKPTLAYTVAADGVTFSETTPAADIEIKVNDTTSATYSNGVLTVNGVKFDVTVPATATQGDTVEITVTPQNMLNSAIKVGLSVDGTQKTVLEFSANQKQTLGYTLTAGASDVTLTFDHMVTLEVLSAAAGLTATPNGGSAINPGSSADVAVGTEVTLSGVDTAYFKVGDAYVKGGTDNNTFTMTADTTIAGDKYHKVTVTETVGGSSTNAGTVTISASTTSDEYVKEGNTVTVNFTLDGSGNASGNVSLVLDTVTGLTSGTYSSATNFLASGEGVDAATDVSGKSDTVTVGSSVATADVTISYTMANGI